MREIIFCDEYHLIKFSILVKNYSLMKSSEDLSKILQGGLLSSKGWLSLPLLQGYQQVSGKSLLPHLKSISNLRSSSLKNEETKVVSGSLFQMANVDEE